MASCKTDFLCTLNKPTIIFKKKTCPVDFLLIFSCIRISFQKLNLDDQSNFSFLLIWILFYICSFWKTKHWIKKSEFCQFLMWWTITGKLEIKLNMNLNKKVQRNKNFPHMFLLLIHYWSFHIHANSKAQKPPSQSRFLLLSIIIMITSKEPWNTETHKMDQNPLLTDHTAKIFDKSEKGKCQLAFELQSSHVFEKRSKVTSLKNLRSIKQILYNICWHIYKIIMLNCVST